MYLKDLDIEECDYTFSQWEKQAVILKNSISFFVESVSSLKNSSLIPKQ